jgi:hypothetical protein
MRQVRQPTLSKTTYIVKTIVPKLQFPLLKYQNIQKLVSEINSRQSRPEHTIHNHTQQNHIPAPYTNT